MLIAELRQAWRVVLGQPGFSALAVGVLAAGLACVIYMLIAIGSLVVRPLPFPDAQRLHYAGLDDGNGGETMDPMRSVDLLGLRRHLAGRAEVAGFASATIIFSDLERPERYAGAFVSGNLFGVLGVAPMLGRDFRTGDEREGAPAVVMLSHALWRARYGADPAIIGRQVRVNAQPATVIGVMPAEFSYPGREQVWTADRFVEGTPADLAYRIVLRRGPATDAAALESGVAGWYAEAAREQPDAFRGVQAGVRPLAWLSVGGGTRAVLGIMLTAVFLVLLVACANVANLLLTRTLGRRQELAIRVALGAGRRRLIVHLLMQSLVLTALALLLAVPLAQLGAAMTERAFAASDGGPPSWIHFTLDANSLTMALAAAVLTALTAGLLPAARAGEAALAGDLRDGARGVAGGRFAAASRVLVIGEVMLSCALLIAVGTLARGIAALDRSDLGVDTHALLTARIGLFASAYPAAADQFGVYERIAERLRADPEVADATVGTSLPALGAGRRGYLPEGTAAGDGPLPELRFAAVDDRFLDTYAAPLLAGRFFDSRDAANAPAVAVVDAGFAERHGGVQAVIGRRFRLSPRDPEGRTVSVIGVIGALSMGLPGDVPRPALLVPLRQQPARFVSLAVRVHGDPAAYAPRLAQRIAEVEPDTPPYWVRTYAQAIRESSFTQRLLAKVFGVFGLIALVLAGAGLYGVMAFNVGQRTREIGVRRALGAPAGTVLRDIAWRVGVQLGIGLMLGLALGVPFARLLSGSLDRIRGDDPLIVLAVLLILTVSAALAVALPARRALRVDPTVALRHE